MHKRHVAGPRLLKGTVIAVLALVALIGLGFIATGLYAKASAELSQLRVNEGLPGHVVNFEPSLSPADQRSALRSTLSI